MIKIYGLNGCPMCQRVKEACVMHGVEHQYIKDENILREKGISHVPVIELDDGTMISGRGIIDFMNKLKE